ncbi:hypothetical protein E8E12_001768 [Didymella heteroderae]|uniref:Uncharacterized protein n=1 Tax=Didymella heteroderae TaxID=1769908 RepID=A0A9P5C1V2_9PLEO|nr:hypothetical protein E8E12_001768 [Didymella heteroderae]
MFSRLLEALRSRSAADAEVSNLDTTLRAASNIPRGRVVYAAYLGEQDIGKSSLVNGVFGHDLVRVSGATSACTAYATSIGYKDGAEDDTIYSDGTVEMMNDEEIRGFYREQSRHYRDANPRQGASLREQGPVVKDADDSGVEREDLQHLRNVRNARPSAASSVTLHAAKTARSFFEPIFDTADNEDRQEALDQDLEALDLESEDFLALCVEQILNVMATLIEKWHSKMQSRTDDIAVKLDEPIQAVLQDLRRHVDGYDGDSKLKRRASDLLNNATRRIGMAQGKTIAQLQSTLNEKHFRYSNEYNIIECLVALEMESIYQSIILQWFDQSGKGSYARGRAHLLECRPTPGPPRKPFPDIMEQRIVDAQVGRLEQCCEQYVKEAMRPLQDFARAVGELPKDGALLISEHRRVQQKLQALLLGLRSRLAPVQRQFPNDEVMDAPAPLPGRAGMPRSSPKPTFGSDKREADDKRAATQPPASRSDDLKRVKTASQPSQFKAMSAHLVAWLRERSWSSLEQKQEPASKREPSP